LTPNSWIALFANEPRLRHAADRRRDEEAAARAASHHGAVVAALRLAVSLDIQRCANVTCQDGRSPQGFVVSRTDGHDITRVVVVDINARALRCLYKSGPGADGRPGESRLDVQIASGGALSIWSEGIARTFATVEELSQHLLAPLFGELDSKGAV
jgi:hypothetical protein